MCGILGFSGNSPAEGEALLRLFLHNERRGHDATGLFSSRHGVVKRAITASKFCEDNFADIYQALSSEVILGHTRLGTMGDKTKDSNAHPFEYGATVGVHNGMISNYETIRQLILSSGSATDKSVYQHRFEVDSMAIFAAIDNFGIEAGIKMIQGSFAIAFVHKPQEQEHEGVLYLYRSGNPIYIGKGNNNFSELHAGSGGLYFSSEAQPLRDMSMTDIMSIEEEVLYGFRHGELVVKKPIPLPVPQYKSRYSGWTQRTALHNSILGNEAFLANPELCPNSSHDDDLYETATDPTASVTDRICALLAMSFHQHNWLKSENKYSRNILRDFVRGYSMLLKDIGSKELTVTLRPVPKVTRKGLTPPVRIEQTLLLAGGKEALGADEPTVSADALVSPNI